MNGIRQIKHAELPAVGTRFNKGAAESVFYNQMFKLHLTSKWF